MSRGIKLSSLPVSTSYKLFTLLPATSFWFCYVAGSYYIKTQCHYIYHICVSFYFIFWVLLASIIAFLHVMYRPVSLCLGSACFRLFLHTSLRWWSLLQVPHIFPNVRFYLCMIESSGVSTFYCDLFWKLCATLLIFAFVLVFTSQLWSYQSIWFLVSS